MTADKSPARPRASSLLEKLVLFHFGTLLLLATWGFGGQAAWVRLAIAGWGAVGVGLFVAACWTRGQAAGERSWPALRYLWPLWLYDALVITSCFNPGFREVLIEGERLLVAADPVPWLPSAARPLAAAKELWQFNVIVLAGFNLYLVLPGRRAVRTVLYLIAGNAVVLAVFGTFQKLVGAKGLWFGLVPSPNARFFSTFIYHNHWGIFVLLATAVCLGLLFHTLRRGGHRDLWHSPVLLGAVVTFLLAASVPLSASRSCTVLVGLLVLGGLVHFALRLIRRRRERQESAVLPVAALLFTGLLAAGAIGFLGRAAIAERVQQTSRQLAREDTYHSRLQLYRDTWRMAAAKPWFGWGLESYAHVFPIFNTHRAVELWIRTPFYAEAHNDWLQSLAEVGFVGTGLLVLLVVGPVLAPRWRRVESVLPRYLLAGCALVLLYAWVEFPFANPAVMLTFSALYWCALRYADLEARSLSQPAR
jgi:O-antigen ligase